MPVRTTDGQDLVRFFEFAIEQGRPTKGDLLFAGENQRARMVSRTMAGVDYEGRPFAPYSRKGPYYYYPGRVGTRSGQSRATKSQSKLKAFAASYGVSDQPIDPIIKSRKSAAARFFKKTGHGQKTGLGVRYESYEDFKLRGLGRTNVDLMGPSAPHMIQAVAVVVDGFSARQATATRSVVTSTVGLSAMIEPGSTLIVGIYGDEAKRAEGHNEGRGVPKRRWFDASDSDNRKVIEDITSRVLSRLQRGK